MTQTVPRAPMPALYIPHGGGPCFFMREEDHPPMLPASTWTPIARYLGAIGASLPRRPAAILLVSAHWIEPVVRVGTMARHGLLFDYYNFPAYTYQLTYPAAGAPAVAQRALALLAQAGHPCAAETMRGLDHGAFIPLKVAFPDADIPIVPMSLRRGLSAEEHLAIGAALAPLRDDDVLIIGSGMSFHNMRGLLAGGMSAEATAFDRWLGETVALPPAERRQALAAWRDAPGATTSHPPGGEEHFVPLLAAAGAAADGRGAISLSCPVNGNPVAAATFT